MPAMVKWKLMLTTLPYVALVVIAKLVLSEVLHIKGVVEFSEVGLVLTGGIFLVGFMLAGTMADFKESERLPAEVSCTLETIEETLVIAAEAKALDPTPFRRGVSDLLQAIVDWLYRKKSHAELFVALEAFAAYPKMIEKAGAGGYASRALSESHNLRKMLTRVGVISRTGFLASGYALLETLVGAIIALLLIASFRSLLAQCILCSFVSLVYIYMLRLIRDIDDPFEYDEGGAKGAAEVELFPIMEYAARLRGRL